MHYLVSIRDLRGADSGVSQLLLYVLEQRPNK